MLSEMKTKGVTHFILILKINQTLNLDIKLALVPVKL